MATSFQAACIACGKPTAGASRRWLEFCPAHWLELERWGRVARGQIRGRATNPYALARVRAAGNSSPGKDSR